MIKNILIAPDSFKGGISSKQFCEIAEAEINKLAPEISVRTLPIADGGEGTLESLKISSGGYTESVTVSGPLGEPVSAKVLFIGKKEAVIETAQCAGLPQVKGRENPEPVSPIHFVPPQCVLHIAAFYQYIIGKSLFQDG